MKGRGLCALVSTPRTIVDASADERALRAGERAESGEPQVPACSAVDRAFQVCKEAVLKEVLPAVKVVHSELTHFSLSQGMLIWSLNPGHTEGGLTSGTILTPSRTLVSILGLYIHILKKRKTRPTF